MKRIRRAILAAGGIAAASGSAMATPITFAQYFQASGSTQEWTVTTSGTQTTVTSSGSVYLSFSGVSGLAFTSPELATFTLSATTNQMGSCSVSCGAGDGFNQPGYSGTFSFIDAGRAPGTDLLSGTFAVTGSPSTTGAQFSANVGSTGGSFNASATPGNLDQLVFTSDYITFPGATQETASFSLSSLIPQFQTGAVTAGNQAYPATTPFAAAGSGTFSSDPAPALAAPEPASIAILAVSLFGIAAVRRKAGAGALAP